MFAMHDSEKPRGDEIGSPLSPRQQDFALMHSRAQFHLTGKRCMERSLSTRLATLVMALLLSLAGEAAEGAADAAKVLHLASFDIETLDPQQIDDDPSSQVDAAIFEGMYDWSYLGSPTRLVPVSATALPEVTDGGKTWTMRLQHGILFTDDPVFKGKPRELVADDIVYSMKRVLDPTLKRGGSPSVTDIVLGARGVVDAATKAGGKFDYDRPMEGLRALDRYTVQLRLSEANYPVIENFVTTGAVAREVVEDAKGDIRTRAVGTGPYKLREWLQGSRIVLEANSAYRGIRFPESDDPRDAELVRSMQGVTLPQIGVIEISIIDEEVTRLLQFERGKLDYVVLTATVAARQLDRGKLKPEYTARGVVRQVYPEPYLFSLYFNMLDPLVGGMDIPHVALRRAMALALDLDNLIDVVYAGQAMPANQLVPPRVAGHDPSLPPKPPFDPLLANALLDRVGYARGADGYRSSPDGKPLSITLTLRTGGVSREMQTLVKKNMDAIGIRMDFRLSPFQELIKEVHAGSYQMYSSGYGGIPSGYGELTQFYSRSSPAVNTTRFSFPDYDRAYEAFLRSANPADQVATAAKMSAIARVYAPVIPMIFRLENDFVQPWLKGFAPQVFTTYWKYLDIDLAKKRETP
jgi:oligopeptide transport system substrate-binding protein